EGVVLLEQEGRDNLLNFANTGVGEIEYEAYLAEVPTNTPANMQISTKHTYIPHPHTLSLCHSQTHTLSLSLSLSVIHTHTHPHIHKHTLTDMPQRLLP